MWVRTRRSIVIGARGIGRNKADVDSRNGGEHRGDGAKHSCRESFIHSRRHIAIVGLRAHVLLKHCLLIASRWNVYSIESYIERQFKLPTLHLDVRIIYLCFKQKAELYYIIHCSMQ